MALKFLNDGYFADKVGIGEQSPSAKLQITTSFASSPSDSIFLYTGGSNIPGGGSEIIFGSSTSATPVNYNAKIAGVRSSLDNGSSDLWFQTTHVATDTSPTTKMIIKSDGKVGIGTTSPTTKFQVAGNSTYISVKNTSNYRALDLGADSSGDGQIIMRDGSNNNKILFYAEANANNYINNGGNLGIGTASPTSNLHVKTGSNTTVLIEGNQNTRFASLQLKNASQLWVPRLEGTTLDFVIRDDTASSEPFRINPATSTGSNDSAIIINGDGNVGIATTAPSQKLHISGNMRLTGAFRDRLNSQGAANYVLTSTGSNGTQWVDASGSSIIGGPYLPLAGGTMTGNIDFGTNNRDISMTDAAGAVTRVMVLNTSNTMYIGPVDTYAGGSILYGTAAGVSYQRFFTGAVERLRIDSSGNVMIGNTGAGAKLDVRADTGYVFRTENASGNTFRIEASSGNIYTTGDLYIEDSNKIRLGASADLQISHDGFDSYINNFTGNLNIVNLADDKDIIFQSDDGSGGVAEYFRLDGSVAGSPYVYTKFPDYSVASFGDGNNLQIYHTDTTGFISEYEGDLKIMNHADDKDIQLMSDDGSGGVTTYLRLDGSDAIMKAHKNLRFLDSVKANFGNSDDLQIYHDGTGSYIEQKTGHMYIMQRANDKGLYFQADDGSGGDATYFTVDGANEVTSFQKDSKHEDNIKAYFGNASDLSIYHNSSNDRGYIYNATGDLYIENDATDGDIKFFSDNSSGGTTEYFRLDGGITKTVFVRDTKHLDTKKALFGDQDDLQIYHDGSNSYIKETGTGSLYVGTNSFRLTNAAGTENLVSAFENDTVILYNNNIEKLRTTGPGVTVTGIASATTFSGDLNGTINTATTGVTQVNSVDNTTIATTAYVNNKIALIPAGLVFQGTWDARTQAEGGAAGNKGNPALTSGVGTTGNFYIVSNAGSVNLDGITDWKVGDWAVFIEQGASDQWEKIDNSSVLDGFGTGEALPLWSGSGTSNTLTNSHITQSTSLANDIIIPQYIRHTGDTNTFFGFSQPDNFIINTNNASALTINSAQNATFAGYVGIGVTPTVALDVLGTNNLGSRARFTKGSQTLQFGAARDTTTVPFIGSETNHDFSIIANNTERMRITAAGNVGIGTTGPAKQLVVRGSAPWIRLEENSASNKRLDLWVDPTSAIGYIGANQSAQQLSFQTASSDRIRILNNGNVGIGTTSPRTKLEIGGSGSLGAVTNKVISATFDGGYSTTNSLQYNVNAFIGTTIGSITDIFSSTGSETDKNFYTGLISDNSYFNGSRYSIVQGGAERLTIARGGNVGIGTTGPQSKLQVAGGIQMADDTATASATKVGTMRYRTGTEYVEVTGTEILPNPGFDTDTNWVKGTGWTIANGKASVDNASSTALSQPSFGVTTGKIYNVRIDVSNYTSGSLQVQFGASQVIASISANGEYNYTVTSTITGGTFYLYGVSDCEFSVDNASVIEVEAENASYADMCMQTGSSTYEWVNIVRNTY